MRTRELAFPLVLILAACGADEPSNPGSADSAADGMIPANDGATSLPDASTTLDGTITPPPGTLAAKYPGDKGIDSDPALVFHESFEEGSVGAVTVRYDASQNSPGMTLVPAVPPKTSGTHAMRFVSGGSTSATDLYKALPKGYDELYYRWYVKYDVGGMWHHSGLWTGGYNPSSMYPNPQAGLKPNGDDRLLIAVEPAYGSGIGAPRFDFYDYWMKMQSWMDVPSGNFAYWGNSLVHQKSFTVDESSWVCLELHVKLNSDMSSAKGAVLEVWKNDALVKRFDEAGPKGYWLKGQFCAVGADGPECTSYPAPANAIVDLQARTTAALKLNNVWLNHYVTDPKPAGMELDDVVVATSRIGCLQ